MSEPFKRTYQIDSHKRISGTSSDFQYAVPLPPLSGANADGLAVVLLAASIPKSYYVIRAGRNTFTLTENGVAIPLTIPAGNYSVYQFRTALLALLNAATLNGSVYSAEFSQITGKFTYSVIGGPSLLACPATMIAGLHDQFGLVPGVAYQLPFVAPNVVNFASQTVLQIRTDLVSNGDNILEQIYAPEFADFSSVVSVTTDLDARSKPLASKTIAAPRFYICDEDEQPVDLNGQNMVISIMIYRPLEYVMREYIKIRSIEMLDSPMDAMISTLAKMLKLMQAQRADNLAAGSAPRTYRKKPQEALPDPVEQTPQNKPPPAEDGMAALGMPKTN